MQQGEASIRCPRELLFTVKGSSNSALAAVKRKGSILALTAVKEAYSQLKEKPSYAAL